MGRLTEAMRRAADVASRGPHDRDVEEAGSAAIGATDDLFPIELENGYPSAPTFGATRAEPAGTAVIVPSAPAPPAAVMDAAVASDDHVSPPLGEAPDDVVRAMASAERGLFSMTAISPKYCPFSKMASASSPTPGTCLEMRTLPSTRTYISAPASPSRKRKAPPS